MTDTSNSVSRQQDEFNQRVNAFVERYAGRGYEGRDLEYELRGIIMDAMRLAQVPYIHDYHKLQESVINMSLLRPDHGK